MLGRRMTQRLDQLMVLAMVFMLVASTVVRAQDTSGLSGQVTDPTGKVIAGATVILTNPATGATRSTKTSDDGNYGFNQVPPGTYTLRVEAKGFKAAEQNDVQLLVATPKVINPQLEVGAVTEVVNVTGASNEVHINTSDATIGNTFNQTQIRQLPLEGRNVAGLLSLQPGVTFIGNVNPDGGTTDYRNGSVNGGKSDQANITLDAVDVNDQQTGQAFN